jgi:hypothetical protein
MMTPPFRVEKQVVMASLITGKYDVNRQERLPKDDIEIVKDWSDSVQNAGLQAILFHNGFSETTCLKHQNEKLIFVRTDPHPSFNPNVFRYFLYLDFLKNLENQVTDVFLTDVSDVVLIRNPFLEPLYLNNKEMIFCGDEPKSLQNEWMFNHSAHLRSQIMDFTLYENDFASQPLLNCGIIGGKAPLINDFLTQLCFIHQTYNQENISGFTGDMGAFNYLLRTKFNPRILHGFPVNTIFKEYQDEVLDCWFRHK